MRKFWAYAFLACGLQLTAAGTSSANDVCQSVLNVNAFNTYSRSFQENLKYNLISDFCSVEAKTEIDFRQRAERFASGGRYGAISGFLNGAKAKTGLSYQEIYSRACEKKEISFLNDVVSSENETVTTENVRAWRACVENREGAIGSVKLSSDFSRAAITIRYKPFAINPNLKFGILPSSSNGFDCELAGMKLSQAIVPRELGLLGDIVLECRRVSESANLLVVNTSAGAVGPFDIPTKAQQEAAALQTASESRISELERRYERLIVGLSSPRPISRDCSLGEYCTSPNCGDDELLIGGSCFVPGDIGSGPGYMQNLGPIEPKFKTVNCQMYTTSLPPNVAKPLTKFRVVAWCAKVR